MSDEITFQQDRFCQELLIDNDQTAAAVRAGYSKKNAAQQASRLLSKANIQKRVNELREKQAKRLAITADRVILELAHIATADITEAYDDSGKLKPLKEIPENVRRSLSGVEVNELFAGDGDQKHAFGLSSKIKTYDKNRALETLAKHFKLLTDKVEHSGKVTIEDLVAGSIEVPK